MLAECTKGYCSHGKALQCIFDVCCVIYVIVIMYIRHVDCIFILVLFGILGARLSLKDQKWALAVESCLKKLGLAYCCHDNHDQQVLRQLFLQVCPKDNLPPIIVSRFQVCLLRLNHILKPSTYL